MDKDKSLSAILVAIISKQTFHKKQIAFRFNNQLNGFVKIVNLNKTKLHIHNDKCCYQFRSQQVLCLMSFFTADLEIRLNFCKAHHFKVLVTLQNVLVMFAKQIYITFIRLPYHNFGHAVYVHGRVKAHQVKPICE